MSDIIDPKKNPEQAAQQLLIELIRAQKTGMISGVAVKSTADSITHSHKVFLEYFKKLP
ncbi:hypothetical protein AB3M75_04990 [Serratia ureilytica]|uniref:hypothetical protein n=1 Tax=Serratia ureilytica TaxID=300181 RepID=UPI003711A4C5